jgi:glycosyltransferase involved in cell wall biosynthesis
VSDPLGQIPEASTIARRLALRLGCRSVALVGCVTPELITSLADLQLAGFDEPRRTSYAAALAPGSIWASLDRAAGEVPRLEAPLAIMSSGALRALDDPALAAIVAAVPAALIHDADDAAGRGPDALDELMARALERDLHVLRGELIGRTDGAVPHRSSPAVLAGDGHDDDRVSYLVAGGFHGLRLDPALDERLDRGRPTRVCIVSYEVVGPSRNGGIGTANTSLASVLAADGQEVTLINTGEPSGSERKWRNQFAADGVRYLELSRAAEAGVDSPFINSRRAWAAYELVRRLHQERPFDIIHGPDCQGHLVFIALAKRHGVAFSDAQVVSGVHSPTRWCFEANRRPVATPSSLADETLERTAVEASDAVVSPSGYMLAHLRARGWRLPERSFVQPYVRSPAIRGSMARLAQTSVATRPDEIVFFGRLETRKGLEVFCDALDQLANEAIAWALSITFMGTVTRLDGIRSDAYIARRALSWPWSVNIETGFSQPEAVEYLHSRSCLAVMPSLVDNSPNTVYEAMFLGVPFVASRAGGTAELIAPADLAHCSFEGWPDDVALEPAPADTAQRAFDHRALAAALARALQEPARSVRPAVDPELNELCHSAWHRGLDVAAGAVAQTPAAVPSLSTIRVRRAELNGDRPTSTAGSMIITLNEDGDRGSPHTGAGWTMSTAEAKVTVAVALDAASRVASGQVLVFLPDGMVPEPGIADVIRRAAAGSHADLFLYPVGQRRRESQEFGRVALPMAGPAVLALSFSLFGAGGVAIRADALRALGGFGNQDHSDDPAVSLLSRALLAGLRIEVIPTVLVRRRGLGGSGRTPDEPSPWVASDAQRLELLRPFVKAAGPLGDLPALYRAMHETPGVSYVDSGGSFREGLAQLLSRERDRLEARVGGGRGSWRQIAGELLRAGLRARGAVDRGPR